MRNKQEFLFFKNTYLNDIVTSALETKKLPFYDSEKEKKNTSPQEINYIKDYTCKTLDF